MAFFWDFVYIALLHKKEGGTGHKMGSYFESELIYLYIDIYDDLYI